MASVAAAVDAAVQAVRRTPAMPDTDRSGACARAAVVAFLRHFEGNMLRIEIGKHPQIAACSVPVVALHALADAVERNDQPDG